MQEESKGTYAVILAGGGGTRLWPLSRDDFPKQFLSFDGKESLLQKTAKRFLHSPLIKKIIVATNNDYETLVKQQLQEIDTDRKIDVLVEPCKRNTAPATALSVKYIQDVLNARPDESVIILPSDHLIEPVPILLNYIHHIQAAIKTEKIVIFGIKPTSPETGYGYIKIGEKIDGYTYIVENFIEKPPLEKAEHYLASGGYYWNAGMFSFSIRTFWEELRKYAPNIYGPFQEDIETIKKRYDLLPNVSIDYALMEKTDKIAVCPLPINWSDVGSWDSIYEVMDKDQNQNVKIGNVLTINTKNSLIFAGKRLISTIGLEDLLVVETDDAILISKKGESQRVKAIIQELIKKEHQEEKKILHTP